MTLQDLGSVGEFIAAIATLVTLGYLALQVRQNTNALRSSTFQSISEQMAQNVSAIVTAPEVADIMVKASAQPTELSPSDVLRFNGVLVMTFRRLESVFVQGELGYIGREQMQGFEISMIPLLLGPMGAAWWRDAKTTFNREFVAHVDARLASGDLPDRQPSLGLRA